jgi:hypothetical protein
MAIDTLGYAKYLEEHGLPRNMAEAHAEAADRFLFPQLVTQADLKLAVTELKSDLTMRVFVVIGLMNALLFALLKIT